jgi:hypothetical protein
MTVPSEGQGLYQLYTTQFSTNIELLLQQKKSLIRGRLREGAHVGKQASPVNQVGYVSAKSPSGRFAPLQMQTADFYRRWVFPQNIEIPQLVDTFDILQTEVGNPQSSLVEAAAAAIGRYYDDVVIAAQSGTAYTGQDAAGLTSETFNTTNFQIASTFGSSSASGLTVAKIIECRRILRHYHNDLETDQATIVIGSQQESDLLNQVQVVSTEFNDRPVLVDGRITRFLNFDIVYSERLATASNVRTAFAFVKSGMYLGIWRDMMHRIDQRIDLSSIPWQVYSTATTGATRLQPGKVIEILCSDSSGSDITP